MEKEGQETGEFINEKDRQQMVDEAFATFASALDNWFLNVFMLHFSKEKIIEKQTVLLYLNNYFQNNKIKLSDSVKEKIKQEFDCHCQAAFTGLKNFDEAHKFYVENFGTKEIKTAAGRAY